MLEWKEYIPSILHMIWVGPEDPPSYCMENYQRWKELMPSWTVRLWTNADIEEFPKGVADTIHTANKGAQKADIMRYTIMETYGGVYMDADVTPHRSLDPIRTMGKVVLCHDLPITWAYIAIGFFAAVPHHPLFQKACELCRKAKLNTPDIHLHTGPRILGEAMSVFDTHEKVVVLAPRFLYRNAAFEGRFGTHTYAKHW